MARMILDSSWKGAPQPKAKTPATTYTREQKASRDRYTGQANNILGGTGTIYTPPSSPTPSRLSEPSPVPVDTGPSAEELIKKAQAEAEAKANKEGKDRSAAQNKSTRDLADQQHKLLGSFDSQRDIKVTNIAQALASADKILLSGYATALDSLQGSAKDNDMAEADSSFANVANAVRERSDILSEAASLGAGETDLLRAQLGALRNYSANQGEVNRSFFDTLRSVNNSIGSLNSDSSTSRNNLFNQSEADKESAWANYYNQVAETWTQIGNIENSNTNISSDSSEAYTKKYGDAGKEAAKATAGGYARAATPDGWTDWDGKGSKEERQLNSTNRAATVNLGGPTKRPEGATLRKW